MNLKNSNLRVILPIHRDFTTDESWLEVVSFCHEGNHQLAYLVVKFVDDEVGFYDEANNHLDYVFNSQFSGKEDGLQAYYDNKFEQLFRSQKYQIGLSQFYETHRRMYQDLIGGLLRPRGRGEMQYVKPTALLSHHGYALMVEF